MKKSINQTKLNNAYYMSLLLLRSPVKRILDSIPPEGATGTDIWIKCRTLDQPTISDLLTQLQQYDLVYYQVEGIKHRFFKSRAKFLKINNALKRAKDNGVIS
jgi:hypothetical protein